MSEAILIERLKSLADGFHGPVKEAMLDAAMALSEADALAARLAEAERLLREAESDPHGHLTLAWGERTRAFLGTPDSASVVHSDPPEPMQVKAGVYGLCPECGQGAGGGYEWHKSGCKAAASEPKR